MGSYLSSQAAAEGPTQPLKAYSPPGAGDKILIPVDGSVHAASAVEFYGKKLHKDGVEVVFVHAIERPLPSGPYSDIDEVNELAMRVEESRASSKALEEKYKNKAEELGIKNFRMLGSEGKAGECIMKAAMMEKPTMIVMGSRGLGPLSRTILGSVSHYVMSHADIPVLVHKARKSHVTLLNRHKPQSVIPDGKPDTASRFH